MHQVVKIGALFHVDCCVNFGFASSPKIWCAFFLLVLWIAHHKLEINNILNYLDDTWGVPSQSLVVKFEEKTTPLDKGKLLCLFGMLKIPWDLEIQVFEAQLEVIGHWVDSGSLLLSLLAEKKKAPVDKFKVFSNYVLALLVEWQRITGGVNWGLKIFLLGRWALQLHWEKTAGKAIRNLPVPLNKTVRDFLQWLANQLDV